MTKAEMYKYGIDILKSNVLPNKSVVKKVNKTNIKTFFYNNQFYCNCCKKVISGINVNGKKMTCKCSVCGHVYEVETLGRRVSKERCSNYIYSVLSYENNFLLVNKIYRLVRCYTFEKGQMYVSEKTFLIGVDVYNLDTNVVVYLSQYLYSSVCGTRRFGLFAGMKKCCRSIFDSYFYESVFYRVFFKRLCLYDFSVKKRFFRYIDSKKISKDFVYTVDVIPFCKALYIYPKIETLYKSEVFRNDVSSISDFFSRMVDNLKPKKNAVPYNYKIMKKMYTTPGAGWDYYLLCINFKCILPLSLSLPRVVNCLPNELITLRTYNYLFKQPFNLYEDYLIMAKTLNLDLSKNKILYPKNLQYEHDALAKIIADKKKVITSAKIKKLSVDYELLSFEKSDYSFYLPTDVIDFKIKSDLLKICLFSSNFDDRYTREKCIIMFADSMLVDDLEHKFVAQINMKLGIVQLHGFRNDIDCSSVQYEQRAVVEKLLKERLEMLVYEKGIIKYKNEYFQSIGKEERSVICGT